MLEEIQKELDKALIRYNQVYSDWEENKESTVMRIRLKCAAEEVNELIRMAENIHRELVMA